MADSLHTNSTPPLYRAIPVLEVADNPSPVFLDTLPASPLSRRAAMNPFAIAWRCVRLLTSMLEWLFGVAVLMVGLAVLAALPVLQFLSLGYLLEAGGRVARTAGCATASSACVGPLA